MDKDIIKVNSDNDTVFGSGKTGFVITNEKIYYSFSAEYG